ncbi:MAG: dihydrolipoamide dehydrogenase [Firmicutes bacterium]|nr:dihydrolipoamide dehydrogenase [Bacillota bacterium]
MSLLKYDVAIIGGGPGGYTAAVRAAQKGKSVILIEKEQIGGTCLNWGCIPTKALAAGAEMISKIRHSQEFGIETGPVHVNFSKLMDRKQRVVEQLKAGIEALLIKNKVDYCQGEARFIDDRTLSVSNVDQNVRIVNARHIVIATGSGPALISSLGYDGQRVITSNEALMMSSIPERLIIIGGGVIGCEFASIFSILGSKVTIIEMQPSILSTMDREVSQLMSGLFRRQKIDIVTRASIAAVRKEAGKVVVQLENGKEVEGDRVLLSIGRVLNSSGLGLQEVGVEQGDRGEIIVNEQLETSVPGVFAIGDVTGRLQLAHVAATQALIAVDKICGITRSIDYAKVPSCIFTQPEIGSVGLTAEAAIKKGYSIKTAKFSLLSSGKAHAMGETTGFVKIIAESETNHLLGVHIVGAHASDLIAEGALALELGLTSERLTEVIHAHPTLSEAFLEAAEGIQGLSIHGVN